MENIIERKIASINAEYAQGLKDYDSRIRSAKRELSNHAVLAALHCRSVDLELTAERIARMKMHCEENLVRLKSLRATVADLVKKMRNHDYAEHIARELLHA